MNKKTSIEGLMLVLGATGLGVGMMYMLDPAQGKKRRDSLRSTAHRALAGTGEMLGSTIHSASDSAAAAAKKVSDYAAHLADTLSEHAHHAVESGSEAARGHLSHAHQHVEEAHHNLMERARSLWSRAGKSSGLEEESHPIALATEITAATVGVFGLGVGLMYMLDPAKGRARRAWMKDKVVSLTRRTGREARHYGRHLGNRMKGVAAHARRAAPWQGQESSMPQSVGTYPR